MDNRSDPDMRWNFPEAISRKKRDRIARWGALFIAAQLVLFLAFLIL